MNSILRSLIVWLVLLAVPFQGFASAAMLACGPAHATSPSAAPDDVHGHGMAHEGKSHDHASMAGSGHADQATAQHEQAHTCSACAACSLGAAIAPGAQVAPAVHAAPAYSSACAEDHVPSVDLALPERPPRPLHA